MKNHKFIIELEGKSAYSISTTTGQTKGFYKAPENVPFPFPYKTGFENDSLEQSGKFFMDQAGVFEVQKRKDGIGKCLRQVINQRGIEWEVGQNPSVETIIGDTSWMDYEVHSDVNICENTGNATISGRVIEVHRGAGYPEGYWFKINSGNSWALYAGDQRIASGNTDFPPFSWHHISIKFKGNNISVSVNNKEVVSMINTKYSHGLAGLGSDFNYVEFDNFEVK